MIFYHLGGINSVLAYGLQSNRQSEKGERRHLTKLRDCWSETVSALRKRRIGQRIGPLFGAYRALRYCYLEKTLNNDALLFLDKSGMYIQILLSSPELTRRELLYSSIH